MHALPPLYMTQSNQTVPAPAQVQQAPTIVQSVSTTPVVSRTDLLTETGEWTWAEFRDFVVGEIIERFGPFPRDAKKEYGIFRRYFDQYGFDAVRVARYAFGPTCDGWWAGAPISITRFCKGSDPFFTAPILDRLNASA